MSYEECDALNRQQNPLVVSTNDVFLNESNIVKIFKLNLNENKTKIEDLEKSLSENAVHQLKLYCQSLCVEIQAAKDLRIESINQLNLNMLERINEYERQLLQKLGKFIIILKTICYF